MTKSKALQNEYNRIYRNLKRSVYGYVKRGISTSFFRLPEKPKKVTEGSLRKLQKSVAEWKYYTGQKLSAEEYEMLPADITRSFSHNISELSKRAHKQSKISDEVEDAIRKYRQDLEDRIAEANADNPDYQRMLDEGYDFEDIPDTVTNEATNLYQMAQYAYNEATEALANGDNKRNWWFVQLKAEQALSEFNDAGVEEYGRLFSFNIKHSGRSYSDIVQTFDAALYDSEQLDADNRFTEIMQCMIKSPKRMNARERMEYDDIMNALGLS